VVTEAGFGADLGAEKFFDLKCRIGNLKPDLAVVVATIRALKLHGGADKNNLAVSDTIALASGITNLEKHIENIKKYGLPLVVAINHFVTDSEEEIKLLEDKCKLLGVTVAYSDVFLKGGEGGIDLAKEVVEAIDKEQANFKVLYDSELSIQDKIKIISKEIYGANDVAFSKEALNDIKKYTTLGFGSLPICIAKTQYSLSDNEFLIGRPESFTINIREVRLSSGAGFIVAIAGNIMTMPGLPKEPAAIHIDINEDGIIEGLF
jgi:formate--tetrahydrofolate ligase